MAESENEILDELKEIWNDSLEHAGTNTAPEGNGAIVVKNAYLNRSKGEAKRPQIVIVGELVEHEDPSGIGSKVSLIYGLNNPKSLKFLNTALVNIGLSPITTPDSIKALTEKLPGMAFNVSIVANEDPKYGPSVYINSNARREDLEEQGDTL